MIFSLLIRLISASLDLQFLMSEIKTARPRIPSPRTAGMMTQHKNYLLKLLRGILNMCAHLIKKMQWISYEKGHVVCMKRMCASHRPADSA
jgi:hypothetical protein